MGAGLAACILLSTVRAEDVDERPPALDSVQVTATRIEAPTTDTSMAVTVLDATELDRQTVLTVADYFHGEAGTFVQQTGPGQGNVIIRGLKGSEILHLVDGFRLNTAFFRNSPNQHLALVDPLNLDRVEAVRGPLSTLYGSDAMGGVVQFLTPEPRFESADWRNEVNLRTRWSSADDSTHSRASFRAGREGLGVTAGISYQDVNDLRAGGGETLPFTGYTQRSGDFKLLFSPASGHELMVSAQYSQQPRTPRPDTLVPGFGQTRPDNAEFLYMPQARHFGLLRYRYTHPTALADSIDIHAGYQKIIDDRTSREFGTPNREIERNASALQGLAGVAVKAIGPHRLTYGVDVYDDRIDSFRERYNIDSGVTSARPSRYPDGSTMDSFAVFITDDWHVSKRFDLLSGVRYSRFDIRLPPVINGIGVDLTPDDFSGNLGFSYALSDGLRMVGNLGRGFRAPNVFDLGTFGDRPSNRFNIPNPALEPETVNSVDWGFKYALDGLDFEIVGYRSWYKNKITSVLTGEVTDSGRLVVQARNATRLDLWGIESGLRWQATEAFGLRASATWTRGDETFEGDEYPADRVPPVFGRLGAYYSRIADWKFEGWLLFASKQDRLSPRDEIDARIDPNGTAGWVTGNARIAWQPNERWRAQLFLENLSDRRYREHGSGIDEPGRNVSLAIDWRY